MQQQIESSHLPAVRTHRPPLAARGTPRSSHRTPCHDNGLDHRNSRRRARLCCSAPPRGGRTARGGGLTASLYVRQAVLGYRGTLRCTRDYPSTTASLLIFFPITDRDCVALPNVNISTSAPPMDEIAVACPPACNNSDARGRAIYVGAVADPGGGTTYAYSSPPLGHRAIVDAAVGLMHAVLAPERLSPSPSCTLRPVFVQGFFIKQANGLSQRCPPPPPERRATTDAAVGLMQTVLAPERLLPSPSRTLRPVFVQELFFLFFFFFQRDTVALCVSICSSR
jgi:hypothetical protein